PGRGPAHRLDRDRPVRPVAAGRLLLRRGAHVLAPLVPRPGAGVVHPGAGPAGPGTPPARAVVRRGRRGASEPLLLRVRVARLCLLATAPAGPPHPRPAGRGDGRRGARDRAVVPPGAGQPRALEGDRGVARLPPFLARGGR